ncbi:hypothetical protein Tco_1095724 [Tanacetum coccineum]
MLTCRRTCHVQSHHQNSGEASLSKDISGDEGLRSKGTKLIQIFIKAEVIFYQVQAVYVNLPQYLAPSVGPDIPIYPKKKTEEAMVDSQPIEEELQGAKARDVGTKTLGGPAEPVLQTQKTPSPSPAFIKENIDETPTRSLARNFSDRFSLESSGTSDTRRQARSTDKSQRTPSKNKEPSGLRRSRRLEDWSRTKEKAR